MARESPAFGCPRVILCCPVQKFGIGLAESQLFSPPEPGNADIGRKVEKYDQVESMLQFVPPTYHSSRHYSLAAGAHGGQQSSRSFFGTKFLLIGGIGWTPKEIVRFQNSRWVAKRNCLRQSRSTGTCGASDQDVHGERWECE